MNPVKFENAYYIKLGRGGEWEESSIEENKARIGWGGQTIEDINHRNWERIGRQLRKYFDGKDVTNIGASTRDLNMLKMFAESTSHDVWITFHNSCLWWCRLKESGVQSDEIKYRAENQIAALATERYRYVEEEPPPWFFLKYYRYLEKYGTACIGSPYSHSIGFGLGGGVQERDDGTFVRPKTPLELGWPLKTREDVVRARMGQASGSTMRGYGPAHENFNKILLNMIKAFHCDGAILPLHRVGPGCTFSMKENARKLAEEGIPSMHYETSRPGNKTDFDEVRLLDQLDVFMETPRLRKLEN